MSSLKALRNSTGKSRAKVAAELDISERHLYRLENGAPLRHVMRLAFAEYYGVEPTAIDELRNAA